VRARLGRGYFDDLYSRSRDPWGFETSEYERNKYELTVFTAMLAPLCDELQAVDVSETAVAIARQKLTDFPNVRVELRTLPEETPQGPFDLIVASEVMYYWPRDVVLSALRHFEEVLAPGGSLLAVHWRKETKTYPLQGDEVHDLLLEHTRLANTTTIVEPEFRLDLFEDRS
jgi:SAM-dependent methyltransferase